jgi:uncharacterized protein (DUF2236 family)
VSRILISVAAMIAAASSPASLACGACDEDKVAATYDHAVVERAMTTHRQVIFVAIDGPVNAAQINRRVAAAAFKVRGVATGTLRTSLSPTAFSFVLDGKQSPEVAVSDFQKAVGDRDIRLTLVRVVRDGVLAGPR